MSRMKWDISTPNSRMNHTSQIFSCSKKKRIIEHVRWNMQMVNMPLEVKGVIWVLIRAPLPPVPPPPLKKNILIPTPFPLSPPPRRRRRIPTSAWWKATIAVGSARRQSCVDFAEVANPDRENGAGENDRVNWRCWWENHDAWWSEKRRVSWLMERWQNLQISLMQSNAKK